MKPNKINEPSGKGMLIVTNDEKYVLPTTATDASSRVPLKRGLNLIPYIHDYNKYGTQEFINYFLDKNKYKYIVVPFNYDKRIITYTGKKLKENNIMKKSELINIIKKEIKNVLNEVSNKI